MMAISFTSVVQFLRNQAQFYKRLRLALRGSKKMLVKTRWQQLQPFPLRISQAFAKSKHDVK